MLSGSATLKAFHNVNIKIGQVYKGTYLVPVLSHFFTEKEFKLGTTQVMFHNQM